jgi:broad specificity phosphatase PhoE
MALRDDASRSRRVVRRLTVVRHASTEWSKSGQHTGRTDIPLDADGIAAATALSLVVRPIEADTVFSSPLQRALDTCRLTGLPTPWVIDPNLLEWDYGEYEGLTTAEIQAERPGWDLFRDGCPGGEDAAEVGRRVDAFLDRLEAEGTESAIAFSHGHVLRVLGARWLGLSPEHGRSLTLDAPSVSTLGWDHDNPTIVRWNQ